MLVMLIAKTIITKIYVDHHGLELFGWGSRTPIFHYSSPKNNISDLGD